MKQKDQLHAEVEELRSKINSLKKSEIKLKNTEKKLQEANQQLDAKNQQLQAGEQQLKAINQQLKASEEEIKTKELIARHAKEYAENIIDTIRHPLLVLDKNLNVISTNQFFYTVFKHSEKETIGKKIHELGNNQWNIPKLKGLLKEILPQNKIVRDFEVEHNFENIGHKIMLLNARELVQENAKERRIFMAIEDITQRRMYEKEMEKLNSELHLKAKELQQILYITTHDLRSPLVNIEGFNKEILTSVSELNSILKKESDNIQNKDDVYQIMEEDIPEAIHFITSSTKKMDKLLKGLLTLSRLGRQKFSIQKIDMNELIEEVIDNFKFDINQNEIGIECDNLPSCYGDESQINQLFSNLIGNSLKFFDPERKGKIKISGNKQKKGCTFIVEDNGIGILDKYQGKVFELFEKLDPKKPGIGLGMHIVMKIVEKHRGSIKLESEFGKGTKFIIFIPDAN